MFSRDENCSPSLNVVNTTPSPCAGGLYENVRLLEKSRLCNVVFGFPKIAQTNANQPIALL
jgi:hypothetical protein